MMNMRVLLLALAVTATSAVGGSGTGARLMRLSKHRAVAPPALRGGSGIAVTAAPAASQGNIPEVINASKAPQEEFPDPNTPEVEVHNIAKFNNWDHRECCVGNAHQWREYMDQFLKLPKSDIPKKIHQIWIGHKQPPIIWCDSWRKRYRSEYPGWEYKLWTDREVAEMDLRTREYYDQEGMFQCKADLLRLEILWKEGGIYIDADMVWLHKDLQDVLNAGKDTGFFCGYEPDTKDKPYSVIGNSFIACTPKHPLVDMLIKYIKAIYPHKRPYHGVEWVTGPLAFTKCISHSQMPWYVPPQIWFYPKFHYVPNPDAINFDHFPDSYAFQFGYTCSGLEGWVANSINRISVDYFWIDKCPQLRGRDWPMGRIRELPADSPSTGGVGRIPKVIHQFAFTGETPETLKMTWWQDFCSANPGWEYRCHSWFPDLKGEYFGCSMYDPQPWGMNALVMEAFALEVLYREGGYHVPLSVPWAATGNGSVLGLGAPGPTKSEPTLVTPSLDPWEKSSPFFEANVEKGFVEEESVGIVGASAGNPVLLERIKGLLAQSARPTSAKEVYPRMLTPMDGQTCYMDFPQWSRFLGAAMIVDLNDSDQHERDAFWLGCTFAVRTYGVPRKHFAVLRAIPQRFLAVTHTDFYRIRSIQDAVPEFVNEMDATHGATGWHFICLALQYKAGSDGPVLLQATDASVPGDMRLLGFVVNDGAASLLPSLAAPPQTYEDFVKVWQTLLQLSATNVSGQQVKVAHGVRRWTFAEDDPRAYEAD